MIGAVGAGIMLTGEDGRLGFVAASEQMVVEAERHQHLVREGACHEAHATNEIVVVDDLATETRWPDYTPRVLGLGLRSVLGVPLNAHGRTIGVINIYRDHPTGWSADDIGSAEILASMGAGYILNANQLRAQHVLAEQLETAIESRDVIGQAKGLIMAQMGVDADGAFEFLRSMSQRQNRKLRDVAEMLIEQRNATRPGPPADAARHRSGRPSARVAPHRVVPGDLDQDEREPIGVVHGGLDQPPGLALGGLDGRDPGVVERTHRGTHVANLHPDPDPRRGLGHHGRVGLGHLEVAATEEEHDTPVRRCPELAEPVEPQRTLVERERDVEVTRL